MYLSNKYKLSNTLKLVPQLEVRAHRGIFWLGVFAIFGCQRAKDETIDKMGKWVDWNGL